MKQVTTLLCTLLLASGTATAAAQDHARHGAAAHPATPPSDEFNKLDANKDAALSREELAKHRLGAHFAMLDADRSGKLDAAEFAAARDM
ncbi:MAG TPA: hypothetical protein VD865_11940 [Stenotrophomonas sp.]|nr:hypothetical protein [Stenotrophomonas sp.]